MVSTDLFMLASMWYFYTRIKVHMLLERQGAVFFTIKKKINWILIDNEWQGSEKIHFLLLIPKPAILSKCHLGGIMCNFC